MRKLFLVDWGKNCKIGRYVIISAKSNYELFWMIDRGGDPHDVKIAEIGNHEHDNIYIELENPNVSENNEFSEDIKFDEYGEEEDVPDIFDRENTWFTINNNPFFKKTKKKNHEKQTPKHNQKLLRAKSSN